MKKLMTILVLTLVVAVSCKKDDKPKSKEDLIVGTWKPIKSVDVCDDGEGEDIETPDVCESNTRTTFHSDGTVEVLDYYVDDVTDECVNEVSNYSWNIVNDNIVITGVGYNETSKIFKLTSTTLEAGEEYTEDGYNCKSYVVLQKVN